jgi:hypothetical protein
VVKRRSQRRPFSASSDIPAAEIADNRDASRFGKRCAINELERISIARTVADSLSMAADRRDCARADTCARERPSNRDGITFGQLMGQKSRAMQLVRAWRVELDEACPQPRGKRQAAAGEKPPAAAAQASQHCVDAVQAGARHQADVKLGHAASLVEEEEQGSRSVRRSRLRR